VEKAAFPPPVRSTERRVHLLRRRRRRTSSCGQFRTGSKSADALYNAGLLARHSARNKGRIAHYQEYARVPAAERRAERRVHNRRVNLRKRGRRGVPALRQAYVDYTKIYRSSGKRIVEAYTRAGRMFVPARGSSGAARTSFVADGTDLEGPGRCGEKVGTPWAAEARSTRVS